MDEHERVILFTAIAVIVAFLVGFVSSKLGKSEDAPIEYPPKPVREAGRRVEARIKQAKDGDWHVSIGPYRHDGVFHTDFISTGDGSKTEAAARGLVRSYFPDAVIAAGDYDKPTKPNSTAAAADAAVNIATMG